MPYLPVRRLPWFDWQMVVLLHAAEGQIGSPAERLRREAIAPQTLTTTRTSDGRVAVRIDHGLDTQQVITMDPEVASGLGSSLVAARGRRHTSFVGKALGRIFAS
ncbi:hypothetical protein XI06_13755 [Bradyrhizobium sp. CCBAU 11434]|nr:hypothetical protein [Bradyrhizobium sp. CCBAU 11434]